MTSHACHSQIARLYVLGRRIHSPHVTAWDIRQACYKKDNTEEIDQFGLVGEILAPTYLQTLVCPSHHLFEMLGGKGLKKIEKEAVWDNLVTIFVKK